MKEENLKLAEVEAVAKRKNDDATTSYHIDRLALDNQQIINLSDIGTLLPGGKTVNSTLMDDDRMALRSGSSEKEMLLWYCCRSGWCAIGEQWCYERNAGCQYT